MVETRVPRVDVRSRGTIGWQPVEHQAPLPARTIVRISAGESERAATIAAEGAPVAETATPAAAVENSCETRAKAATRWRLVGSKHGNWTANVPQTRACRGSLVEIRVRVETWLCRIATCVTNVNIRWTLINKEGPRIERFVTFYRNIKSSLIRETDDHKSGTASVKGGYYFLPVFAVNLPLK